MKNLIDMGSGCLNVFGNATARYAQGSAAYAESRHPLPSREGPRALASKEADFAAEQAESRKRLSTRSHREVHMGENSAIRQAIAAVSRDLTNTRRAKGFESRRDGMNGALNIQPSRTP